MPRDHGSQEREIAPWLATIAWIVFVSAAVYLKGQTYDPSAKLSLGEWANIAELVSAIVAPIAVLWVVRSFYVQKRELAAAVSAANEQSKALGRQVDMIEKDRIERLSPTIFLRYRRTIAEEGQDKCSQNHKITLLNVGAGAAYESHFHIVGDNNGSHGWLEVSTAMDAIPPGQSRSTNVLSYISAPGYASTSVLIELSFKNREKADLKAYYHVNLHHDWQKTVSGTELSRDDYLERMKAGHHPVPSSFRFNAIDTE